MKGFSEIFLDPVSLTVDSSRRVTMINGYEVGVLLRYNPELYDHRNKLSNVPPGATLYPIKAKFALATSYGLQKKLVNFPRYRDAFGELVCKWISDEDI